MLFMFANCSSLKILDLSSFNTPLVTNMEYMFSGCSNLRTIYVSDDWTTEAVTRSEDMFYDCLELVGGQGTAFNPDSWFIDKRYAHIDGGPDDPGYLTAKPAFIRGDVNDDLNVTIADVTALVNIILGRTATPASGVADVNTDGKVTIADVTALVNIILGKNPEPQPEAPSM